MLRLEKKARTRSIHVTMREGGRLMTPAFRQALLLALGFHLFGFMLFHVKSLDLRESGLTSPPVQVRIDMTSEQERTVLAQVDRSKTTTRLQLEPKPSNPSLLQIPRTKIKHEIAYPREKHPQTISPLMMLDHSHLAQSDSSLFTQKPLRQYSPVTIRVSGPLAERKIIDEGWNVKNVRALSQKKNFTHSFISFDVKVEDKTGKIIWYKKKQTPQKKTLRHEAENILHQLAFEQKNGRLITSGHVEMILTLTDGEAACFD